MAVSQNGKQVVNRAYGLADLERNVAIASNTLFDAGSIRKQFVAASSPEQQFFISWGQFRGAAETLELQREMVKTDTHATAKYRVIGPEG